MLIDWSLKIVRKLYSRFYLDKFKKRVMFTSESAPLSTPGQLNDTNSWHLL
jgi:hypothetical protein